MTCSHSGTRRRGHCGVDRDCKSGRVMDTLSGIILQEIALIIVSPLAVHQSESIAATPDSVPGPIGRIAVGSLGKSGQAALTFIRVANHPPRNPTGYIPWVACSVTKWGTEPFPVRPHAGLLSS